MGYYILQGGTSLQRMSTAGALTTLTLPTGVTLDSTKVLRGTTLGSLTILTNSPSVNLCVDRYDNVRVLCPQAPASAPSLTTAASGALSGTFATKVTFVVKDEFGNLIMESSFGPTSAASSTLASNFLVANNLAISSETITARRVYRTTTGPGSVYYQWIDVDGNTITSVQDDLSDASLQLVAAPTDLGAPPKFDLITAWKDRLWARSPDNIDTLYQSATNKVYAWPPSRTISIPPAHFDVNGITGFMPRKDELGVGRRTALYKITGTNENNFTRVTMSEHLGVWAPDSCVVVKDIGYFLGNPFGIYTWGPQGVQCISDDKVRGWFTTDTYFNRSRFDQAIGCYDPYLDGYTLMLSAAGSTSLDRWIFYDIKSNTWWGPHKTSAFTPTGCASVRDGSDVEMAVLLGSDGKVYKPQSTYLDGTSTAIDMDVLTNPISADTPDIQKYWDMPTIVSKIQAAGSLSITPYVGGVDAPASTVQSVDLTLGRQRLPRLGTGRLLQLRFQQASASMGATIYGVEIPFFEVGRR